MRKKKLISLCLLTTIMVLFVSTGWARAMPEPRYHDEVPMHVEFTYYWTYDPDFEGFTQVGVDFDLKRPDGTVIKTVDRGLAARYHMEGSGFIEISGTRTVINVIDDGGGDLDKATFDTFDYVDWGLDAPCYGYGLVPWRTIAVKEEDIPVGSMVYIERFDGYEVPVPDVNDPHNQSKWTMVKHDGWFKATDVSWSFYDGADVDSHIDIFAATYDAYQKVDGDLNLTELDIEVHPYTGVLSFITNEDEAKYRYIKVTGPQQIEPHDYTIYSDYKSPEQIAFGEFADSPKNKEDVNDMLVMYPPGVYAALDAQPPYGPHWLLWNFLANMASIALGDVDGAGNDEKVMFTEEGFVYVDHNLVFPPTGAQDTLGLDWNLVTVGDLDGDDTDDIALASNEGVTILWMESGQVDHVTRLEYPGITCLVAADTSGNVDRDREVGKENLLVCSESAIISVSVNRDGTVAAYLVSDEGATAAAAIKLDPDNKADVLAILKGQSGVYVQYTSHNDGAFRKYMDTTPRWLTSMVIKNEMEAHPSPPEWEWRKYYDIGDHVLYGGDVYECTYYHYSQPGWEPDQPQMWSVWQNLGPCD